MYFFYTKIFIFTTSHLSQISVYLIFYNLYQSNHLCTKCLVTKLLRGSYPEEATLRQMRTNGTVWINTSQLHREKRAATKLTERPDRQEHWVLKFAHRAGRKRILISCQPSAKDSSVVYRPNPLNYHVIRGYHHSIQPTFLSHLIACKVSWLHVARIKTKSVHGEKQFQKFASLTRNN